MYQMVVLTVGVRVMVDLGGGGARPGGGGAGAAPGSAPAPQVILADVPSSPDMIQPFWQTERDRIQNALDLCGGNVQEVAKRLEISPATLYRKIEKFGLVK